MDLVFELVRGGSAQIVTTDGDRVTLASSAPSPPGSTLELSAEGTSYRVKVRGCRRSDAEGSERCFHIEGRWVSLTREGRERVLSATGGRRQDQA